MTSQMVDQINPPNATQDSPQPSSGKGGGDNAGLQGSQGSVTFPGQGGQPEMGMPNAYSNTIGQGLGADQSSWDNSSNQSSGGKNSAGLSGGSAGGSGKGKGA